MNDTVNWPTYLRTIAGGDTGTLISQKTGIPDSTISRWLSGEVTPRPSQVVTVARTYGEHPIPALIAAGYLTAEEADMAAITPRRLQLREFTELELAEEMVRRIAEGESTILESPLDGNHPAMKNVSPIRKDKKPPRKRLDAVAFEEDRGPRIRPVRIRTAPEPKKKAALRDEEMNQDEKFD